MGQEVANSSAGNYGINMGGMALTWAMRFLHGKLELWTGKAMSAAHRKQSSLEKAKRKEAKRKAKAQTEMAKRTAMENYQKEFMEQLENDGNEMDDVD